MNEHKQPGPLEVRLSDELGALVAKLRYMGRQYASGQAARGGSGGKHYLEDAADQLQGAFEELANIANARRFDRGYFDDDTEFADWVQARCRYVVRGDAAADRAVKGA